MPQTRTLQFMSLQTKIRFSENNPHVQQSRDIVYTINSFLEKKQMAQLPQGCTVLPHNAGEAITSSSQKLPAHRKLVTW